MATSLTNFASEGQLSASPSNMFSTNTSEKKFIGNLTLTNTSASNVEVYLWRIATTTTATTGSGGNWIERITIPAGRTVRSSKLVGHVLGSSMRIQGQADTASVINYDASGTTET